MDDTLELITAYVRTLGLFTLRGCEFRFNMIPVKGFALRVEQYIGFVCSDRIDIARYVFPEDREGVTCMSSDFVDSYRFDPDDIVSFRQVLMDLEIIYGQIVSLAHPKVKQKVQGKESALIVHYPPKKARSP